MVIFVYKLPYSLRGGFQPSLVYLIDYRLICHTKTCKVKPQFIKPAYYIAQF